MYSGWKEEKKYSWYKGRKKGNPARVIRRNFLKVQTKLTRNRRQEGGLVVREGSGTVSSHAKNCNNKMAQMQIRTGQREWVILGEMTAFKNA